MADVTTENRGSALWIRLNRPERRNAYDAEMAAGRGIGWRRGDALGRYHRGGSQLLRLAGRWHR